ncbi:site-specific integrase [Halocynthiibacter styelae]|uniref:Site-specific integrase n=1 Tax=Halocynthiibacter styelae TaxID=2761955 RepID=A0A8J7J1S1_9RHOB|nr:site-specific integrase [Paenihalocynthiibacter styelae]MBI1495529.1 site-specific integrase [Paenihalocynthiibacter styelae]
MIGLNYVTRRGAIYIWRRRLPARVSTTAYIQISLRTARFSTAKILANLVNSGFEACSERMKSKRITQAEAQCFLTDLVAKNLEQIEEERYYEPDATTPEDWRKRYFDEKCRAVAYRLVATRGQGADLFPEDLKDLSEEGFDADHLSQIRLEIEELKREVLSEEFLCKSRTIAQDNLNRSQCGVMDLRAVGALRMAAKAEALDRADRRKIAAPYLNLDLDRVRDGVVEPKLRSAQKGRYSDELPSLISDYISSRNRDVDDTAERKKIAKDVKQRHAVLAQFLEATGVSHLGDMRQEDMFYYVSVLERLPKIYRKTPEDQARTLDEVLERAEELSGEQIGLSPATINRNVTIIQGFLKYAKSRGAKPAEILDLSVLRKTSNDDERNARLAFSDTDMTELARHPVWTGCASLGRRNEAGGQVIKDGLYWGPILASLTGARREEILGMQVEDVDVVHDIPHLRIRKNVNRRLKNAASERLVPMHRALLDLGFGRYVEELRTKGEVDLFPELKPQCETGSFGDVFYRKWKPVVSTQLGERSQRRTFHSFRHRFISVLRHTPNVPKEAVQDLVGHKHHDETDGRYRKTADYRDQILARLAPVVNAMTADEWQCLAEHR